MVGVAEKWARGKQGEKMQKTESVVESEIKASLNVPKRSQTLSGKARFFDRCGRQD